MMNHSIRHNKKSLGKLLEGFFYLLEVVFRYSRA